MIQNWLQIVPATEQSIILTERTGFMTDVIRSQLWYRGDSNELFQFFHQTDGGTNSFWGSVPKNEKIRKIHSGLPAIIADTLAYIVKSDFDNVQINRADWEEISKQNDFKNLIGKAVCDTLVDGDGTFKISVDTDVSAFPIVDFIGADKVRYDYKRGVLHEVIFVTDYTLKSSVYRLEEHYGKGYVRSILYNSSGNEVRLETVPELAGVLPEVTFDGDYIMAVPLKFYASKKYQNRGKSIFDGGKSDCFDALDEVVSQWWDAIRAGRVKQYIPESMTPRSPKDGSLIPPTQFGNDYIIVNAPLQEGVVQKIEVVQPDIKYEAFVNAYTNCLLMCLQGLVSPATLGIDVGKMQSADAQREKKDVTGNTRNTITSALENALPKLIKAILYTYDNMRKVPLRDCGEITVSFGEYGAPDFDSRVETVGKACTYGIMSVKTQVEELWGSSKDDEWKQAEIQRIMSERGLLETGDLNAELP